MNKTIQRLTKAYEKAVKDFNDGDFSELDVRYTWALNRVHARACDLAEAVSRHLKHEHKLATSVPKQCDYVIRAGTSGYLCCRYKPGHKVPHRDTYDGPNDTKPEDWMPVAVWKEKFGAAARACYAQPGRARPLYKGLCKWCGQSEQNHVDRIGGAADCNYEARE